MRPVPFRNSRLPVAQLHSKRACSNALLGMLTVLQVQRPGISSLLGGALNLNLLYPPPCLPVPLGALRGGGVCGQPRLQVHAAVQGAMGGSECCRTGWLLHQLARAFEPT